MSIITDYLDISLSYAIHKDITLAVVQLWILGHVRLVGLELMEERGEPIDWKQEWISQRKSDNEFLVLGTEHLMVCLGG